MIVFVEGPRGCGKTYLLNKFFERNDDPRIVYYKFYFADWVKKLGLKGLDNDKALHYLSLGNILTILEQMKDDNKKILVFDRAIISAYTWAALRKRLSESIIEVELETIVMSNYYTNCKTLWIDSYKGQNKTDDRNKDMWDNIHSATEEAYVMSELIKNMKHHVHDIPRNNELVTMYNDFTDNSLDVFTGVLNQYLATLED